MQTMNEVIISTYNNPVALNCTLQSFFLQSVVNFKICIADDGSGEETAAVIKNWQQKFGADRLRHIWHTDIGFNKNKILNEAIHTSVCDYLIFVDGDCIADSQFVRRHLDARTENQYLTGGVIRFSQIVTKSINASLIRSGELFSWHWLSAHGCLSSIGSYLKASFLPIPVGSIFELITPVKSTWNGGNSSGWRAHLLAINGFDETMAYGGEDVNLGIRLRNYGVKGRHIRYTAPLLHIYHERGYVNKDLFQKNKEKNKSIKITKEYFAINGILKR